MAEQLPLPGIGGQIGWAAVAEKVIEQNALMAVFLAAIGAKEASELPGLIKGVATTRPQDIMAEVERGVGNLEQDIGSPIFTAIVDAALGFNISDQSGQAANAVRFVERAVGFGALLPIFLSPIIGALESHMGNHAPKDALNAIKNLGNDLGLNFFIGNVLSGIFETASAPPIREAIARQTHPARLDYREIRALLKAHALSDSEAQFELEGVGYTARDIDLLKKLDRVWLNTSELSNEFMHGRISEGELESYLDSLGYVDTDMQRLKMQWTEQAQAQGASAFRDVMRRGVLENRLSVDQYVVAMRQLFIPESSIQLDVAAIQRELEWGRIQISVGQIKQFFQKGEYGDTQAITELIDSGYDDATANALIKDWSTEAQKTKAGIGISRILSYELSGVVSREDALKMLIGSGLSVQFATLLATNPSQYGGLIRHERTPQTLISAFKEDVINVEQLRQQMAQIGTAPAELDYLVRIAIAQKNRESRPRKAVKNLTEGEVIDATKYGLATMAWGVRELELLGWSEGDAQLIIATEKTKLSGNVPDDWTVLT